MNVLKFTLSLREESAERIDDFSPDLKASAEAHCVWSP